MTKSKQNFATVDIFSVSRKHQRIETQVPVKDMPELCAFLCDVSDSDMIDVVIEGCDGAKGLPGAILQFSGEVSVPCTRCMKPIAVTVEREVPFLFVMTEAQANRLPIDDDDEWEIVVGSDRMNVAQWVQEEAILSLPNFPRHDDCEPPVELQEEQSQEEIAKKPNPFANLRDLMKKN